MAEQHKKNQGPKNIEHQTHRMRLPGFLIEEDVGLGDVIKRVTHTFGIRPCGGCEQRTAALNRWLVFTGSSRRSN